jgi:hypothetical protein
MKKLYIIALAMPLFVTAQNVGIGTINPTENLDVNGNINVTGTIKVNGIDGTPHQVLKKNHEGVLLWSDMSEYRNRLVYNSSNNFIVPSGVTKVMVEAWGARGGGNVYGGGGGGFIRAIFAVNAGNTVTITVGTGGSGAIDDNAFNGLTTTVSVNNNGQFVNAFGGQGADIPTGGPGRGGTANAGSTVTNIYSIQGEDGQYSTADFFQGATSTFIERSMGGNGGDAGNAVNNGGQGAYGMYFAPSTYIRRSVARNGKEGGGGGGGGIKTIGGALTYTGGSGASGMVAISY